MKSILISGVHGFVGSNLVMALKDKYSIYGLDIISPEKEGVIHTFSWKDIDLPEFPTPDIIIHLAGKAHDTKNLTKTQEYFDINTGLTQKIFDYFLQSSTQKFMFFSTVKAAADFVVGEALTEDVIPTPKGPYGESKIKAEEYIKERWNTVSAEKQIYILRPSMIHGPGNKGNLNLLYNLVKKGLPWPLGDFENKRSFTSIDNLCYIIDGLISKDISTGIYHIADDDALSTNELIRIICDAMNKKAHIWKINKGFMTGCAKLGSAVHLPLNLDRLHKLTENYVVSNVKIKNALNIQEMPVKAKDGLKKTIQSFSFK